MALAGWVAPAARDYRFPNSAESQARRQGNEGRTQQLPNQVADIVRHLEGWKAPTSLSFKESHQPGNCRSLNDARDFILAVFGTPGSSSDPTRRASTGALNPDLPRWLQGYPAEWGRFAATATRSVRRSPQK